MNSTKIWLIAIASVISWFIIGALLQKIIDFINLELISSAVVLDIIVVSVSLAISIGLPYMTMNKRYGKKTATLFIKRAILIFIIFFIIGLLMF